MYAPDPTGTLPALLELHDQADKLSAQIGGLERTLRDIVCILSEPPPQQLSATTPKLANSLIVASGQSKLWGFSGTNTKASAQFLLAFDANTVPANGAVPEFVMTAQASSDFWVSWTPNYRWHSDGIVICNSSTAATLTIGSADCWIDCQWSPDR